MKFSVETRFIIVKSEVNFLKIWKDDGCVFLIVCVMDYIRHTV